MNKLIVSMTLLFLGCTLLSSVMEGGGGLVATALSGNINNAVVTVPVDSTEGFLTTDVVVIGNEQIAYTGVTAVSFTGCTRGSNDTEAQSHLADANVYSSELSPMNAALGFNVASTTAQAGALALVMIPYKFFTQSVPRMVLFDYSFFTGQLAYLQIFFQAIGVGFAITMAFWVITTVEGILTP